MGPYRPRSMPVGEWLLQRRVITASGCWEWPPAIRAGKYGFLKIEGRDLRVHRLAYELWRGPIPEGRLVCHTCDNKPCFNPAHLFTGDDKDNAQDRERKQRGNHVGPRLDPVAAVAIAADRRPNSVIAAEYGMDHKSIWAIKVGRTWSTATGIAPMPVGSRRVAGPPRPGPGAVRGEHHPHATITEEIARVIAVDPRTNRQVAAALGVGRGVVESIREGRAWGHATGIVPGPRGPARGERNRRARLTSDAARAIAADPRPIGVLATEYQVSRTTIHGIRYGLTWTHATGIQPEAIRRVGR